MTTEPRTVRLRMSDRCFRFKPEAIPGHAPAAPGVYELVTFDERQTAKVVYVGLALDTTIREALAEHWRGLRAPKGAELLQKYPNIYFDFVAQASIDDVSQWKDVADALIVKHRPELNPSVPERANVELKEVDIL